MNSWLRNQINREWHKSAEAMGRVNVAIFGKTGVGKSTLVNAVFGANLAQTGTGRPVTRDSHLYETVDGPLGLLDTRGIEVGPGSRDILKDLATLVRKRRSGRSSEQIHVAWYCVLATGGRFEQAEEQFIRDLADLGIPVCIVLTQTPMRNGQMSPAAYALATAIDALDLPVVGKRVYPVMAVADEFSGMGAHGLEELLGTTFLAVPQSAHEALTAAQQIDLDRKRQQCATAISAATTAAGAAALSPLPLSDAAIIVPTQLAMIARISMLYGVTLEKTTMAALAATTGATATGRSLVGNLAKLVPGYGTVAGGAINASVATSITWAMGQAWMRICELVVDGDISADTLRDPKRVREIFTREFKASVRRVRESSDQPTPQSSPGPRR